MDIAITGAPAHTRTLAVSLSHGTRGETHAHGEILDLRKRGLIPIGGDWQTAGIIHQMRVDARVGADLRIESMRADQPHVAVEATEASRGECCRDPVRRIEALKGTTLDAAYAKRLGAAIGGPLGCSHILTLAQLLGSTVNTALAQDARFSGAPRADRERFFVRNVSIDGLETEDGGLELSAQLADIHLKPVALRVEDDFGLVSQHEIRIEARIGLEAMQIERIRGEQRRTTPESVGPWNPVDVSPLEGHPALSGMARTVFHATGDDPQERPLRDVLLNLAPAIIQCIPALGNTRERWRDAQRTSHGKPGSTPMAGGGMVDSCYIWRRGGGLHQRFEQQG